MIVVYRPDPPVCNFDRECREIVEIQDAHTGLCRAHLTYYMATSFAPRLQLQTFTPSAPDGPIDAIRMGLLKKIS